MGLYVLAVLILKGNQKEAAERDKGGNPGRGEEAMKEKARHQEGVRAEQRDFSSQGSVPSSCDLPFLPLSWVSPAVGQSLSNSTLSFTKLVSSFDLSSNP